MTPKPSRAKVTPLRVIQAPNPKHQPIGMLVQLAALESDLAPELRHLVHVLAWLADNETGRGLSGQDRIAQAMGITSRSVRSLMARLEADVTSPVILTRQARMRPIGKGRTSDEYWLSLRGAPTGSEPPLGPETNRASASARSPDQPEVHDTTNRKPAHDQPEAGARPTGSGLPGISSEISSDDLRRRRSPEEERRAGARGEPPPPESSSGREPEAEADGPITCPPDLALLPEQTRFFMDLPWSLDADAIELALREYCAVMAGNQLRTLADWHKSAFHNLLQTWRKQHPVMSYEEAMR